MPIDTELDASVASAATTQGPVIGLAWASDIDDAFDAAKGAAIERYGSEPCHPTLAMFDAGTATTSATPCSLGAAVAVALAAPRPEPGELIAVPLAAQRRWARRRLRVRSDDLAVAFPEAPGRIWAPTVALREHLDELLVLAGAPRDAAEVYDEVELMRLSERYKPAVTRHSGRTLRVFAVIEGSSIIGVEGSAAAARRRAVELVKGGSQRIEVVQCGLRHESADAAGDGAAGDATAENAVGGVAHASPTLSVDRTLVRRTAALRIVLAQPKTPELPVDGWLFYGTAPAD
jgi:hypothetical protein